MQVTIFRVTPTVGCVEIRERSYAAVRENYILDDPAVGQVSRDGFEAYFADLSRRLDVVRGGPAGDKFLELANVVTSDEGDTLTAWCWWSYVDTPIQGSGLIVVDGGGVVSERLAYYASFPT